MPAAGGRHRSAKALEQDAEETNAILHVTC